MGFREIDGGDRRGATRRRFLREIGRTTVAGSAGLAALGVPRLASGQTGEPAPGRVRQRTLGKTGLKVSEIGFGGHSWAYSRVPDGQGGFRKVNVDEAVEMISAGLDMGVNFFDSCTPHEEHTTPGEAIKRLKRRDKIVVSARLCHRMKGVPADKDEVFRFVDERLKMWQTDYFDLLMLSNTENDTGLSGFWEMSYSIEAVEKLKQQGKIRFAGFGSHFTPELFLKAFELYGKAFDVCSMPYNVRHRAAEKVMPAAKKANLGVVTIKPFARGSLLNERDLTGADAGLPRDMIAFVLENDDLDVCICGVHTEAHVRENFSASWTRLSPERRKRLEQVAASTPCEGHRWLEEGWLYA